jgi:hypothetical protein
MPIQSIKHKFMNSTAAAALLVAFGATGALAQQANVTVTLGTETIATTADYTAGNDQKLSAAITGTTVGNNVNISLMRSDGADDIVTAAAPMENNTITTSATGNISTGLAVLAFGPSSAGDTAAVGTLQSVEANVSASIINSTFSTRIENAGVGTRTFTGTTLQDNNDATASATGNSGTSSITANASLDLVEDAPAQANVSLFGGSSISGADLVVSSSQEIDAVGAGTSLTTSSNMNFGTVSTRIETLDGATVMITNNDQALNATGNTATNSILSLDTTASITAATAVSNLQSLIGDVSVSTGMVDSSVQASAGGASGTVDNSTVSVKQNTQTAASTGSVSTQVLTLDANSITGEPGGFASIQDANGVISGVDLDVAGDAVIGNSQSIGPDVTVAAQLGFNNIRSQMNDLDGEILGSSFEVDGNVQSSSSTGVSTSNALSLTSGATMSATGAVASLQSVDGTIAALTEGSDVSNRTGAGVDDSSMLTTNNIVSAGAIGASALNTLSTTAGTNNLSLAVNTGSVDVATAGDAPSVGAGMALTNTQAQSATASVTADAADNLIVTSVGDDAISSTVTTDGNTLSSSATANSADNGINLSFNELTGTISGAGTGIVAGLANEQTLADNMTVTARNVGQSGTPILTEFDSDAIGSSVSTSSNTVSVSARGNVTTGNDVVVDATNIASASQAVPSVESGAASSATGGFVSLSNQESGADILASQLNIAGTTSNTILTEFGDDIEASSTVVSDLNTLSASATANTASNAVQLGTNATALIAASGVVGNLQQTLAAGSVTAQIGIAGSDPSAPFTSSNSGSSSTGTLTFASSNVTNGGGSAVTLNFLAPLSTEEVGVLSAAGYTGATVGGSTALLAAGATADFSIFTASASFGTGGFGDGDESFSISNFSVSGTGGNLNGAGVIASIDTTGGGEILASTVSVSGNMAVGEVNGNVATNVASATATTVTGLSVTATSANIGDLIANPIDADLAAVNVQDNAAALQSGVAATFAITAGGEPEEISGSTQTVSNNLQQSFATANRATTSVLLTATNTNADTALENVQESVATVATTSELDVVANAGATSSSLSIDGNRNQSVANGNIATNVTTLDVTNAAATGAVDASGSGTTGDVTANNVLASVQSVTADVTTSAATDVYNEDLSRPTGNEIVDSNISMSRNATTAQATGNNAGQTLTLGDAGTANMERTGLLLNSQNVTASAVSSIVDQDVSVTLNNTSTVPVQSSSLSLDGNSTTALARSNVATNTLSVDGANILAGAGTNAAFTQQTAGTLVGGYVLGSTQGNDAAVSATTTQSRVEIDMANAAGNAIDDSTLSLSNNASSATATANTVANTVSVGANSANVNATAALANVQTNTTTGAVSATGGSAVGVFADGLGTDPVGINGTSILLSGNTSASSATGNRAENALVATGTNITSGGIGLGTVDSTTSGSLIAAAGNLLLSDQANNAVITSTNTANTVTINSGTATGTGAAAVSSTLSVAGNATEARATANLALNNSINIGSSSTAAGEATGIIGNFQFNDNAGTVTSSASTITTVSLNGATAAGALSNGSAFMQDNSTLALARGNVVENALNAQGSTVGAGASPATTNSQGSPDSGVLNASFGVFNEQVQQAAINATSANARYSIDAVSGTGLALNAASASVSGNSINATAFGNVATNRVTLASLNGGGAGNDASAAIFNGQINSGAITATTTGATIGTFSTGSVAGASIGVMGNSISATAVGNFATSTVTRASR